MKTIHKHILTNDKVILALPIGYEILAVGGQGGSAAMWVLGDVAATTVRVSFSLYGTGWDVPNTPGKYLGTCQLPPLVWHVFENGTLT